MIGVSRPRTDSEPKLAGATRYAADLQLPGLLHARPVLALHAHALIERIDAEAAVALPGVVAVLTAADLPLREADGTRGSEPLARAEVVFAGQPVALVVAETEAAAEDGAEAVIVELTPLEPVVDAEAAMAPDAPPARVTGTGGGDAGVAMHADVGEEGGGRDGGAEQLSANVFARHRHVRGDVEGALAGCDAVVEGRFRTGWVHQCYLEPQVALAWVEPDRTLVVHASTQGIFYTRKAVADAFGLPLAQVRVVGTPLGGAFGGKLFLAEPLAAGAALALRRPVRVALTRSEDFAAGQPAPATVIELRVGGRRSGELVAIQARIVLDAGAFSDWSVDGFVPIQIAGPYRWQAWDTRAYGVLTNRFGTGAYRAPGGPQCAFALETLLDELAGHLGIDALELRRANAVAEADEMVGGGSWPGLGLSECLESASAHPLWARRDELPPGEGIGAAAGAWIGARAGSAAMCRLESDGSLTVQSGFVDMTGTGTVIEQIAAEAFGLPVDRVTVVSGDTATAPFTPPSGGSMVTYSVGRAVQAAAEDARAQLLEIAAAELEIAPADLELVDGVVRPAGSPERGVEVSALAARLGPFNNRTPPVEGHGGIVPGSTAPSCAVHLAHVRVDRDTGQVEVLGYLVVQDVGRALNPALVEGQMRGGVAQGIGWALLEELAHDDEGQLLTGSFASYAVPGAEHVPPIETIIVEVPAPEGPYGAKGVGEACVVGGPAAIANAVAAATGLRPRELPLTAPRLWHALAGR